MERFQVDSYKSPPRLLRPRFEESPDQPGPRSFVCPAKPLPWPVDQKTAYRSRQPTEVSPSVAPLLKEMGRG